jgi:hypothetical protein
MFLSRALNVYNKEKRKMSEIIYNKENEKGSSAKKVGTNFDDKRRSLGRYSSLAGSGQARGGGLQVNGQSIPIAKYIKHTNSLKTIILPSSGLETTTKFDAASSFEKSISN